MFRKCFLTILFFLSSVYFSLDSLKAQEIQEHQPSEKENYTEPGIAVYIELLGKCLWYSVNVDYRIKSSTAIGLGIAVDPESFVLNSAYYYLIGKKKRFEVGGGLMYVGGVEECGAGLHGVIGYRYQIKNGLLFRIGFTPIWVFGHHLWPWVGISVGYSS